MESRKSYFPKIYPAKKTYLTENGIPQNGVKTLLPNQSFTPERPLPTSLRDNYRRIHYTLDTLHIKFHNGTNHDDGQ